MSGRLVCRAEALSHVGKVRKLNEDSLLSRPEIGLFVVADGMGGHGGGDLASQAVVGALSGLEAPSSASGFLAEFEAKIVAVNAELRDLARRRDTAIVGTTLAALLIYDAHFACVWCGDSRVYLFRRGELTRLSRDHSEVQELIDRGVLDEEEAKTWPRRNIVTRALGASDDLELEIIDGPAEPADRFLLCSDGLIAHLDDDEIAEILGGSDLSGAVEALVAETLRRGASDNVSVIAVECVDVDKTVRTELGAGARVEETTVIPLNPDASTA